MSNLSVKQSPNRLHSNHSMIDSFFFSHPVYASSKLSPLDVAGVSALLSFTSIFSGEF